MKRSKSYVATFYPQNAKHRKIFDDIRLIVKMYNHVHKTKFRVMRMGRLGFDSPYSTLYCNRVDGRNHQMIRVAESSYFDIYVHDRDTVSSRAVDQLRYNLVETLRCWTAKAN